MILKINKHAGSAFLFIFLCNDLFYSFLPSFLLINKEVESKSGKINLRIEKMIKIVSKQNVISKQGRAKCQTLMSSQDGISVIRVGQKLQNV